MIDLRGNTIQKRDVEFFRKTVDNKVVSGKITNLLQSFIKKKQKNYTKSVNIAILT